MSPEYGQAPAMGYAGGPGSRTCCPGSRTGRISAGVSAAAPAIPATAPKIANARLVRFPARPGGSSRPGRSQPDQSPHRPVALRRRRRQAHLRGYVTETSTGSLPARPHPRRPGNLTLLEPHAQQAGPPRAQCGHFSRISIMIPATPWRSVLASKIRPLLLGPTPISRQPVSPACLPGRPRLADNSPTVRT
jgi:hypothetical protein